MMANIWIYDNGQLIDNFLAARLVATVVNKTILIELTGINIAATTGVSCPAMANESPTILYSNEIEKLILIIRCPFLASLIYSGSLLSCDD